MEGVRRVFLPKGNCPVDDVAFFVARVDFAAHERARRKTARRDDRGFAFFALVEVGPFHAALSAQHYADGEAVRFRKALEISSLAKLTMRWQCLTEMS
jgi:hypothetical protein